MTGLPDDAADGLTGPAPPPVSSTKRRRLAVSTAFFAFATGLSRIAGLIREIVAESAWTRYNRGELTPGPDLTSDAELGAFVRKKLGTSYLAATAATAALPATNCRRDIPSRAASRARRLSSRRSISSSTGSACVMEYDAAR